MKLATGDSNLGADTGLGREEATRPLAHGDHESGLVFFVADSPNVGYTTAALGTACCSADAIQTVQTLHAFLAQAALVCGLVCSCVCCWVSRCWGRGLADAPCCAPAANIERRVG